MLTRAVLFCSGGTFLAVSAIVRTFASPNLSPLATGFAVTGLVFWGLAVVVRRF